MAFQIGDTVRLISGNWYSESGSNLVGGEYVVVKDDAQSEFYIDPFSKFVEVAATRIWTECFELVVKPVKAAPLRVGDTVELLERYETDDDVYVAITEYHDEAEEIVEADNEVIILKVLEENGEEYLAEIEDEMEFEQVSDILMAMVEKKYDVEYFEPEQ